MLALDIITSLSKQVRSHLNDVDAQQLQVNLSGWCSNKVYKQYRLIFRWEDSTVLDAYLASHAYKG
ncbi:MULTISPECIES: type II toxin-antitoxin system RelE/ParE family toxin [Gammaproteobacteria]|uniref:type II toxin-antitoxin system RelE/ParE family toxin n=1 Tax=Gammaproteobacteria TaxID=1236 RepID=UPI000DA1D6CC|nr:MULTISPECIES: type II toxin-antitoxin system RelE/ParE family toxin [Halomonadaceae]MBY5928897.1 type II toxin-antitoxin system RelE/ParE family toxin [Halomonas sp. DP8Y7-3]